MIFLISLFLWFDSDLLPLPQTNASEIRLINSKTGHTVVEFIEEATIFHDCFLESEMQEVGILIPFSRQSDFLGKEVIYLNDPLFKKAFLEIYYPISIANALYQWQ